MCKREKLVLLYDQPSFCTLLVATHFPTTAWIILHYWCPGGRLVLSWDPLAFCMLSVAARFSNHSMDVFALLVSRWPVGDARGSVGACEVRLAARGSVGGGARLFWCSFGVV